jgi:hypothetical protein
MSLRCRILIVMLLELAGVARTAAADAGVAPPPMAAVPAPVRAAARAALDQRLARDGVSDAPVLAAAEAVTWPDGGLGCARPGAVVTQALVPGYRLVYTAAGRRYEVHASAAGAVTLCGRPRPRAVPPPPSVSPQ